MVQQQFDGRDAADEQALSHDRHRIDLEVFTNNDEGGFHRGVSCQLSVVSSQLSVVSCQLLDFRA
jgi:hypothetical protein